MSDEELVDDFWDDWATVDPIFYEFDDRDDDFDFDDYQQFVRFN